MVSGTPKVSQINHLIGKQILSSLQRTYADHLCRIDPVRRQGKTTWARAVFEPNYCAESPISYNLWCQLPKHPVPICRVTRPLTPDLISYCQAGLPTRGSAHPSDRLISNSIITCLDDCSEFPSDNEVFPVLVEYTVPKTLHPEPEPSVVPNEPPVAPTPTPRTHIIATKECPNTTDTDMARRGNERLPGELPVPVAGTSRVDNNGVVSLDGRCPLISPIYLKACTSSFGPYKSLVLTSISSPVFKSSATSYDDRVILMADIFCHMRLNLLDKHTPARHNVLLTGELAAPYLPEECYQPPHKADETFSLIIVQSLPGRAALDYFPTITAAGYEAIPLDPTVDDNRLGLPPVYPFTTQDLEALNIHHLVKLLRVLLRFSEEVDGTRRGLFIITNLIVAICKQGTISGQFIEKVRTAMRQDLGSDIAITTSLVGSIWGAYGQYINENNVGPLMKHFLDHIMAEAIRLRITINQSKYQGLTMFQTIGRAMLKYPDMAWHLLERVIPQEFINYKLALRAVGDNPYYGYSASLDLVKAANFRNLGYLSKELLVKLNNEGNLNYNRVFEAKPDKARIIDKVILRYITEVEKLGDEQVLGPERQPSAIICHELQGHSKEIQELLNQNPICFT